MVAAPAVLEELALAPVAVPVPEELVVDFPVADDEPPVVAVALELVLVREIVVGKVAVGEVSEPEEPDVDAVVTVDEPVDEPVDDAVVELSAPLEDEQLSPALMAEQKASAAGRT